MIRDDAVDDQSQIRQRVLDFGDGDPTGNFKLAASVCLGQVSELPLPVLEEIATEALPHINAHRVARQLEARESSKEILLMLQEGRALYTPEQFSKHSGIDYDRAVDLVRMMSGEGDRDGLREPEDMPYLTAWPKLTSQECDLSAKTVHGLPVVLAVLILMDICRAVRVFFGGPLYLRGNWDEYDQFALFALRRALQLTQLLPNGPAASELRLEAAQNASKIIRDHISQKAKKAARASHASDYAAEEKVFQWMDENHHRFKGNLNALAREIVAQKVVANTYEVVRRRLTQWKKLHSARRVDTLRAA